MGARSKFFDPRSVRTAARAEQGDLWHKLLPWGYALIFVGIFVAAGCLFQPVIRRHRLEQMHHLSLQRQISDQQVLSIRLQEELYALQEDPYYVERMARDILNYGREGETIFKFPPFEPETRHRTNK